MRYDFLPPTTRRRDYFDVKCQIFLLQNNNAKLDQLNADHVLCCMHREIIIAVISGTRHTKHTKRKRIQSIVRERERGGNRDDMTTCKEVICKWNA